MKIKLFCLHGFLGEPRQFDFLKEKYDIYAPNLSQYVHLSFDELYAKILDEYDLKNCHILGYSFGARLGAALYHKLKSEKKLIMLAGHLGLNDEERPERIKIEKNFIEQLEILSEAQFLEYWNNLDLFQYDEKITEYNFANAILYFKNYGLSKQKNYHTLLKEKQEDISIYYGERDQKYCDYAKNKLGDYQVRYLSGLGHRLLAYPKTILDELERVL